MAPDDDKREVIQKEKQEDKLVQAFGSSEIIEKVRRRTPARLLEGRSGASYRTNTQLSLREAHAAARDAVRAELNLSAGFSEDFVRKWNLFEVGSRVSNKDEYLLRPDLGRSLNDVSRVEVLRRCSKENDLQIVIGDGLSVTAVVMQVPRLLPLLCEEARIRGWSSGSMFVIRYCRVGILNEIGELLRPRVAVLLIGERPGLANAESLSAYMAYQPKPSDTDANRNLISNIHRRGVSAEHAAKRISNLAALMMNNRISGYQLREEMPAQVAAPRLP